LPLDRTDFVLVCYVGGVRVISMHRFSVFSWFSFCKWKWRDRTRGQLSGFALKMLS
jgi:hypothetical protein